MTKVKSGKKGRTPRPRAGKKRAASPPAPAPEPTPRRHSQLFESLPASLQEEMNTLLKHEAKILAALEKDEARQQFISDPAAALEKMKVSVPAALRKRLKPETDLRALLRPRQFRLANGQVLTPKVRIRFTRE
jgi:hypothetical protein